MFVQAYGAALLIILASIVLGRAICVAVGGDRTWSAAPAVGLATLIVLAGAAIKLPGRDVTAIVVAGLAIAAAGIFLVRRRSPPMDLGNLVVSVVSLLGASIPFIANGRVGLPGVSLDNDTANHLLYTEALRSSRMAMLWGVGNGYPLGPHSLVAAVGTATGAPVDMAFTGLLVAIVPITALAAAGLLADSSLWRRVVIGVMCSLGYLLAAYYCEGAFKETILACLLLAFVVHIEQVRARWNEAGATRRFCMVGVAGILVTSAFYTYSYPGLAWFVASGVIWIGAEAVTRPRLLRARFSPRRLRNSVPWLLGTAGVAVALLLPVAGQALTFFNSVGFSPSTSGAIPASALGNLMTSLSPYEMLGVWTSPDFRRVPTNGFHAGELSAVALIVLLYGLVRSVRRRELLLPSAAAACFLVWWLADHGQSPYVTAKALVIGTPVMLAVSLRGLLARRAEPRSTRILVLVVAIFFCGFAAYSSYQTLRSEPVASGESIRELGSFRAVIGDRSVLFLGDDDYAPWELREAGVSALASNTGSLGDARARMNKPYVFGEALDFDSVDPADLDRFPYVVTSNTAYASQPPPNFRPLASTRLYELWQRTGPTVPRKIVESSGEPGAILNCESPLGRKLRATRAEAAIMATPVTVAGPGLTAGASAAVPLPLPRGPWELSIQYFSSFEVQLSAPGHEWKMPPYLGRQGPFFNVGAVTGRGVASPVTLFLEAERPSFLTGTGDILFASIPVIAATRIPNVRRLVPLHQACGKYVDWYR